LDRSGRSGQGNCGVERAGRVSLAFASWNRIGDVLRKIGSIVLPCWFSRVTPTFHPSCPSRTPCRSVRRALQITTHRFRRLSPSPERRARRRGVGDSKGDPEVGEHRLPRGEEDVLGLEIAVDPLRGEAATGDPPAPLILPAVSAR
jgi:hypothetical protein